MSNTNQFDWVAFYKELASKLLQFKNGRAELVAKVIKIYEVTGINMFKVNSKVDDLLRRFILAGGFDV